MNSDDLTLQISSVAKHYSFHNPPDLLVHALRIIHRWLQGLKDLISSLHIRIPFANSSYLSSSSLRFLVYLLVVLIISTLAFLILRFYSKKKFKHAFSKVVHVFIPDSSVWKKQAQLFAQEKNWKDACRALYLCSLQIVSEKNIMSYIPTRTNYEYLYLLNKNKELQQFFRQLISIVEEIWFGNKLAVESDYLKCTEILENINQIINTQFLEAS